MEFNINQWSIINGSLLGDAYITPIRGKNGNCAFVKVQCKKRREYLEWHYQQLLPLSCSLKEGYHEARYIAGHTKKTPKTEFVRFSTWHSPLFRNLRNKWYPLGCKIVPDDLILDPLSIAIWFADDGQNYSPCGQAIFHTQGFCEKDRLYLIAQLKLFDIYSYTNDTKRIYVRGYSYLDFMELISPFMTWKCFGYKTNIDRYKPSRKCLCEELVPKIFNLYYEQHLKQMEIAQIFGVDASTVSDVIRGKSYGYLGLVKPKNSKRVNGYPGKGVSFEKQRNKWKAFIGRKLLGRFDTEAEALAVRQKAVENNLFNHVEIKEGY